jgi:hypothetical protein
MTDTDTGWLTYAEAAQQLGCTPDAVRQRARRFRWPVQRANQYGQPTRIRVPAESLADRPVDHPAPADHQAVNRAVKHPGANGVDHTVTARSVREIVETSLTPLTLQLGAANRRAEQAEAKAAALQAELVELRIAERVAADLAEYATGEVADLRARLAAAADERRMLLGLLADRRPWWRRYFRW